MRIWLKEFRTQVCTPDKSLRWDFGLCFDSALSKLSTCKLLDLLSFWETQHRLLHLQLELGRFTVDFGLGMLVNTLDITKYLSNTYSIKSSSTIIISHLPLWSHEVIYGGPLLEVFFWAPTLTASYLTIHWRGLIIPLLKDIIYSAVRLTIIPYGAK